MKYRSVLLCVLAVFVSVLTMSCTEKTVSTQSTVSVKSFKKVTDQQVIVMLGNDYETRSVILDPLVNEWGLVGADGLILPLMYPSSFTVDKRIRLSVLSEALESRHTTVIVTVGAPEGTVKELSKIRNAHPEIQIISLFSMDDILPVESVSDLVLDSTVSGDLLAEEKALSFSDTELAVLVFASVLAGEETDSSIAPLDRLITSIDSAKSILKQKKIGSNWSFSSYIDPETNLRSRNHVILDFPQGIKE